MRLGVISDTHGENDLVGQAMEIYRTKGVDQILHCGDIGSAATVELFQNIPTHFVLGNCDQFRAERLQKAIEATGNFFYGNFGELELEGKKIVFFHDPDDLRLDRECQKNGWDLACHGHTHHYRYEMASNEKTVILNPGAVQARGESPCCCLVELPQLTVQRISLRKSFPFLSILY